MSRRQKTAVPRTDLSFLLPTVLLVGTARVSFFSACSHIPSVTGSRTTAPSSPTPSPLLRALRLLFGLFQHPFCLPLILSLSLEPEGEIADLTCHFPDENHQDSSIQTPRRGLEDPSYPPPAYHSFLTSYQVGLTTVSAAPCRQTCV